MGAGWSALGAATEKAYESLMAHDHNGSYRSDMTANVLLVALFALGIAGAAGALSPIAMSTCAAGLGGVAFGVQLIGGNLSNRKFSLLTSALFAVTVIALGALGFSGMLSPSQIGIGAFSTLLIEGAFYVCGARAIARQRELDATPPAG